MLSKDCACVLTTPCSPHHPLLACFAPANAALLTKLQIFNVAARSSARRAGSRAQRTTCRVLEETAGPRTPVTQFGGLRANGTVVNLDAFHDAFDVKPGDQLYRPSEARVRIW